MTLGQLIQAASVQQLQHGPDVEVIVRGSKLDRLRLAGTSDEWELLGVEVDEPLKPFDGGEVVVVLRVEG